MTKDTSNSPAVKKDLDEAVSAILKGMDNMFKDHNKDQKESFEKMGLEVKSLESHLTNEISGLKAEFSKQVSKDEFNELKTKVDKYIAAN